VYLVPPLKVFSLQLGTGAWIQNTSMMGGSRKKLDDISNLLNILIHKCEHVTDGQTHPAYQSVNDYYDLATTFCMVIRQDERKIFYRVDHAPGHQNYFLTRINGQASVEFACGIKPYRYQHTNAQYRYRIHVICLSLFAGIVSE